MSAYDAPDAPPADAQESLVMHAIEFGLVAALKVGGHQGLLRPGPPAAGLGALTAPQRVPP